MNVYSNVPRVPYRWEWTAMVWRTVVHQPLKLAWIWASRRLISVSTVLTLQTTSTVWGCIIELTQGKSHSVVHTVHTGAIRNSTWRSTSVFTQERSRFLVLSVRTSLLTVVTWIDISAHILVRPRERMKMLLVILILTSFHNTCYRIK